MAEESISLSGDYASTHTCCMFQEKPLDLESAIKILENVEEHRAVAYPPVKPKGGEVYLFIPQTLEEQDNWKCDHYRWLNNGPKEIPRRGPLVRKLYFLARVPEGKTFQFQRHAYVLIADTRSPKPVLVHYIGDESIMIDFPHGNSKKTVKPFYAVAPSVRKEIARKTLSSPNDIIESMKSRNDDEGNHPAMSPRNKNQIRNLKRRQRIIHAGSKIKKSSLNNVFDMVENIPGFIHYLQTVPDIVCVVGLPEMTSALEELFQLSTGDPIVFSYCEPFKIGRVNIAFFMFEHIAFAGKPGFPSHAVIYDSESEFVHEKLLKIVSKCIPELNSYKGPIVVGRDSTSKTINSVFPNLFAVTDWEHMIVDSRLWLRSTGATVSQINTFTDHLRLLLDSPTKEHYTEKFARCSESWTTEFRKYYDENVRLAVETRLGRWILQRYNLFSKGLGVTDIVNENLQILMRDLQEVRDPSADTIAIALYHLSIFLSNEITKGYCNIGTYKLRPELQYMLRAADEVFIVEHTFTPTAIAEAVKANGLPFHASGTGDKLDENLRGERIHSAGNIHHVSPLQAFLVKGVCDDLHAVKLYPREYCTCLHKDTCCHIIAVKLSLGLGQTVVRSKGTPAPCIVVNVTQPSAIFQQQTGAVQVNSAAQTIANLVASGAAAAAQAGGQQVFTLDSFIEALTVARECIVSPANATGGTVTQASTTVASVGSQ